MVKSLMAYGLPHELSESSTASLAQEVRCLLGLSVSDSCQRAVAEMNALLSKAGLHGVTAAEGRSLCVELIDEIEMISSLKVHEASLSSHSCANIRLHPEKKGGFHRCKGCTIDKWRRNTEVFVFSVACLSAVSLELDLWF